jgi:hypothetical protein
MSDYEVKSVSKSGDNVNITLGPVTIKNGSGPIEESLPGAIVFAVAALIFLPFVGGYWLLGYFIVGWILSYFLFVPTFLVSIGMLIISFLR